MQDYIASKLDDGTVEMIEVTLDGDEVTLARARGNTVHRLRLHATTLERLAARVKTMRGERS